MGPDGQTGLTALTCFFIGFRADFVTSVRVSVASAGVLAPAGLGPENPKGAHPLHPLGYVPVTFRRPFLERPNSVAFCCDSAVGHED